MQAFSLRRRPWSITRFRATAPWLHGRKSSVTRRQSNSSKPLQEEKNTDKTLTGIAKSVVNVEAEEGEDEDE
jgi:hypothetical protein